MDIYSTGQTLGATTLDPEDELRTMPGKWDLSSLPARSQVPPGDQISSNSRTNGGFPQALSLFSLEGQLDFSSGSRINIPNGFGACINLKT